MNSTPTGSDLVFKTVSEMRCDLVAHTATVPNEQVSNFTINGLSPAGYAGMLPCSAARVSHGREDKTGEDTDKDIKLMEFLADHNHMTPFEHQSATFLVECPIFVAREWMRHRTQSFNEISRRYTALDANVFWIPDSWRGQSKSNRQASAGDLEPEVQRFADAEYKDVCQHAYDMYEDLLSKGVARELARGLLPVGSVTKFYATANLRNWAHWYKLRIAEDAQYEIRVYAERVGQQLQNLWPLAWGALAK